MTYVSRNISTGWGLSSANKGAFGRPFFCPEPGLRGFGIRVGLLGLELGPKTRERQTK
jgi:hypothetical protein